MVLIKNKKQGTTWEITDEAHLKRLFANPQDYEVVSETKPGKAPKEP